LILAHSAKDLVKDLGMSPPQGLFQFLLQSITQFFWNHMLYSGPDSVGGSG
jgi:hypothetical protein